MSCVQGGAFEGVAAAACGGGGMRFQFKHTHTHTTAPGTTLEIASNRCIESLEANARRLIARTAGAVAAASKSGDGVRSGDARVERACGARACPTERLNRVVKIASTSIHRGGAGARRRGRCNSFNTHPKQGT